VSQFLIKNQKKYEVQFRLKILLLQNLQHKLPQFLKFFLYRVKRIKRKFKSFAKDRNAGNISNKMLIQMEASTIIANLQQQMQPFSSKRKQHY
jgi:hypothetical protein